MSKDADSEEQASSFDLDRLRRLLHMMDKYGVTEVNLQNKGESWKIRRGPKQIPVAPAAVPVSQPPVAAAVPATQSASASSASAAGGEGAAATESAGITIDAPAVGTFYAAPNPDEPPFVSVGDEVRPDTIVCVIEAMKVFNQIPAEKSGRITEILVENGDPVEFGQPLFRLQPA